MQPTTTAVPAIAGCVPGPFVTPIPGVVGGVGSEYAFVGVEGAGRGHEGTAYLAGGWDFTARGPLVIQIQVRVHSESAVPAAVTLYGVTTTGDTRTVHKVGEQLFPADGASARADAPGWFQWLWTSQIDESGCFQIVIITPDGASTARFAVVNTPPLPGP